MALADKLNGMQKIVKKDHCAYQTMYNALSPEDKEALDEAWAKGYSANVILIALRSEGIKSSNEAIRQHKIGACKCPKPTK
jgi:dihydroorotase-like cyclic amidohydrolase